MQRINDVDVAIANIDQWTGLVFAVLELALLMGTEFRMEMASDLLAQGRLDPRAKIAKTLSVEASCE